MYFTTRLAWKTSDAPAPGSVIQSWFSFKIAIASNTYVNCICHAVIGEAGHFCGRSLSVDDITVTLKDSTVMSAYDKDFRYRSFCRTHDGDNLIREDSDHTILAFLSSF